MAACINIHAAAVEEFFFEEVEKSRCNSFHKRAALLLPAIQSEYKHKCEFPDTKQKYRIFVHSSKPISEGML